MSNGENVRPGESDIDLPKDIVESAEEIGTGYSQLVDPETLEIDPGRMDQLLSDEHLLNMESKEHERLKTQMLDLLERKKMSWPGKDEYAPRPEGSSLDYLKMLAEDIKRRDSRAKEVTSQEYSIELHRRLSDIANTKADYDLIIDAIKTVYIPSKKTIYDNAVAAEEEFDSTHPDDYYTQNSPQAKKLQADRMAAQEDLEKANDLLEIIPMLEFIGKQL